MIATVLIRLALAALFGGMLFFAAVMAPLVFTTLPPDVAGPFIRGTFPRDDLYIAAASAIGIIGYALHRQAVPATVLLAVLMVTLWLRFWLMPHLDAWRLADAAAFQRGHRLSVWINLVQFVAVAWLLLRRMP